MIFCRYIVNFFYSPYSKIMYLIHSLKGDKRSCREEWIDSWRGLLILLVVVGHVLGTVSNKVGSNNRFWMDICCHYIYYFHVPAFFVISGLLWKDRDESFLVFLRRRFMRLMIPYYAFGVMSITAYLILGAFIQDDCKMDILDCVKGLLHGGGWPGENGLKFNSPLWFFPCLFVSEIVFWGLKRLCSKKWVLILCLVPICVVENFVAIRGWSKLPLGFSIVPRALIFMILGHVIVSRRNMVAGRSRIVFAIIALLALVSVVNIRLEWNPIAFLRGAQLFGQVFLCAFASAVMAQAISCRILAALGRETVVILCIHKFFILAAIVFFPVLYLSYGVVQVCAVIFITLFSLLLGMCCSRIIKSLAPVFAGDAKQQNNTI